jgi:hypothetical protein
MQACSFSSALNKALCLHRQDSCYCFITAVDAVRNQQLVINLDNGPHNSSHRIQFMKRLTEFADKNNLGIVLAYYPPYHSIFDYNYCRTHKSLRLPVEQPGRQRFQKKVPSNPAIAMGLTQQELR